MLGRFQSTPTDAAYRLAPGECLHLDFRDDATRLRYSPEMKGNVSASTTSPLRLMTWNIERGYKLKEIIELIRKADPDILCVQEIDIGCDRSQGYDTGVEIARALQLNYIFQLEFVEIGSRAGSDRHGLHGNGIFTKFNYADVFTVFHEHQVSSSSLLMMLFSFALFYSLDSAHHDPLIFSSVRLPLLPFTHLLLLCPLFAHPLFRL